MYRSMYQGAEIEFYYQTQTEGAYLCTGQVFPDTLSTRTI